MAATIPSAAECVSELTSLLAGPDVPLEVREIAADLLKVSQKCFVMVPEVGPAPVATEFGPLLQPSDLLWHVLEATRTRDWDDIIVLKHRVSPESNGETP